MRHVLHATNGTDFNSFRRGHKKCRVFNCTYVVTSTVWVQNFAGLKFLSVAEAFLLFNFRKRVIGVMTMPFSGLAVQ